MQRQQAATGGGCSSGLAEHFKKGNSIWSTGSRLVAVQDCKEVSSSKKKILVFIIVLL